MPDTFIQQQNRLRQRNKQKNIGFEDGAVFLGVITGDHDSENEKVSVSYHAGLRKMQTLYPYLSADSWIRTAAEGGQAVLAAQRPDTGAPDLIAYTSTSEQLRIKTYNEGGGVYRPLSPGEIEIHSRGTAQSFYSRRPSVEHRAGLVRSWLDQDRLESGARSPVHVRHLHLHRGGTLGDEERFGVVARPADSGLTVSKVTQKYIRADRIIDPVFAVEFTASAVASGVIATPGPWAKEYTRIINSGAIAPAKLVDIREGDVIDDSGTAVRLSSTGKPLRYKGEWFADGVLGGAFYFAIDQDGNFSMSTPTEASTGGDINISSGDLIVNIGKAHTLQVQTDYTLSTANGQMTIDSQGDYRLTVNDGSIALAPSNQLDVGAADEPAVLGNQLLDFLGQFLDLFSQHFHTGNMGAPTPLDPGGLSQTTQLKANFIDQRTIVSDYINFSKNP